MHMAKGLSVMQCFGSLAADLRKTRKNPYTSSITDGSYTLNSKKCLWMLYTSYGISIDDNTSIME